MSLFRSGFFLTTILFGSLAFAQDDRPNILLIIADDLGYTDLGAFGSEIPTPALDELAFAGMRLTNFHTAPACQETRSMLMSGRGFASSIELKPNRADGERANSLRTDVATIPELLRDSGYRTYMAGKWDLGLTPETSPPARGFDRSFALLEASSSHFAEYFWDDVSYYAEDGEHLALEDLPEDFYSTISYTDKLLEYLREHEDGPWFGFLPFTAPHWPLQVPDEWLDRHAGNYDAGYDVLRAARVARATALGVTPVGASLDTFEPTAAAWASLAPAQQRRYTRAQEIYASMVELLDQQVGRIVAYLEETGQLDDTLIMFMSDHGASAAAFGMTTGPTGYPPHFEALLERRDNTLENFGKPESFIDHGRGFAEAATAPLKYFKTTLAEGGIRAAAFMHYPAMIAEPAIDDTFLTVMDILPTFLDVAGSAHPGPGEYNGREIQSIAGRSFWPYIAGEASTVHGDDHAAGWVAWSTGAGAITKGRYKLTNQPVPGQPVTASWQLYDLEADPGEINDIAASHPELVDELLREWERDWQQ